MADERYNFRTIHPEQSRRTESSKRAIPKKEKKKLIEYLNVTDCNKRSFTIPTDFGELGKPNKRGEKLHRQEIL